MQLQQLLSLLKRMVTRESKTAVTPAQKKPYTKPEVKQLIDEQAKLKLLGHASQGDKGAMEILRFIFGSKSQDKKKDDKKKSA